MKGQKGGGGRGFCSHPALKKQTSSPLGGGGAPIVGPVADENKAHSGTRMARTLKTRHDQNNQPKTAAPGRADEPIKFPATARGDERTNHRHTPGAISFSYPVGDGERHDVRCGHSNKIRSRPLRAAGRATITNRLTSNCSDAGACLAWGLPLATHHDRNGPASVPQAAAPSGFRHTAGFLSGASATLHRAAFDSSGDFLSSRRCVGLRAARSPIRGGVSVMAEKSRNRVNKPENQPLVRPPIFR